MRAQKAVTAVSSAILMALLAVAPAPAKGPAVPSSNPSSSSSSSSLVAQDQVDPALERLQRRIVRDRDRGRRGNLKLGALSDGYFGVIIDVSRDRVEIVMPPLRAKRLKQTRQLVANRYRGAPVRVRLARFIAAKKLRDPETAPRPGQPFSCRGDAIAVGLPGRTSASRMFKQPLPADGWNAKRIIGKPLPSAKRMALRHGCGVREVLVDGMELMRTMDYRSNRINVAIRAGKVTRILSLG